MNQSAQILFLAISIILTILLVVIGWQIYQILSEFRKIFVKINKVFDGVTSLSANVSKSVNHMTGFTEGLKTIANLVSIFKKKGRGENG